MEGVVVEEGEGPPQLDLHVKAAKENVLQQSVYISTASQTFS